jgi:16S rRNA (cytosine967-C5)-methyltransferase
MSGVVSPARAAAFDILTRVEEDGAYASVLLADDQLGLSAQDRSLTYELVLGTLRRQFWLDTAIAHFAGRPLKKIDPPVLRALRLGLLQLRFLDRIPPSAAVNESVNLVHRARLRSATGLTNAVLRRALREPEFDPTEGIADPVERLAVETSHPAWLLARWKEAFGWDQTRSLAEANNQNPVTAFRFTRRVEDPTALLDEFGRQGVETIPSPITPGAWRVVAGAAKLQQYAARGLVYIQDEASQWVARFAGANHGPLAPATPVLDVCAAPGSKATLMADLLAPNGSVIAGDLYPHRLRTVLESAGRAESRNLAVVAYDATNQLPFADGAFGTVLIDAPCSGTGTLRRNPEIRWRISPVDIEELARKQRWILANAARAVSPGGILIYSTCSLEPEENEAVIDAFLRENDDFKGVTLAEIIPSSENPPEIALDALFQGRFWPQRHGTEGFFVAAMTRESGAAL